MIGVAYFIFVKFSFFSAESELSALFHFPPHLNFSDFMVVLRGLTAKCAMLRCKVY